MCCLELLLLCEEFGRNVNASSLILCDGGIDQCEVVVDGRRSALQIVGEIDIAPFGLHLYVVQLGPIGRVAVEHTQTTINRQVRVDLIRCTDLYAVVVLTALHIAIHVVTLSTQRLEHVCNRTYDALEGS